MISKTAIISLILIVLIHSLYIFLKTNLTVPKIKDLVNKPHIQYEEIYNTLNTSAEEKNPSCINMKDELKKYLKSLTKKQKTTPIGGKVGNDPFNNFQTL